MKKTILLIILLIPMISTISLAQQGSAKPSDWCSNMRSAEVWYSSSFGVSIGVEPTLSFFFTRINCCVNGTDMDACNSAVEDAKCSQIVVRQSCEPLKLGDIEMVG